MEALKVFFAVASSLAVLSACGIHQKLVLEDGRVKEPETQPVDADAHFLEEKIPLIDGSTLDLTELKDKPLVLMFAGFACNTCAEEVQEFRASFNNPNQEPSNVRIISVVVGEDGETAEFWKEIREVPWTVGFDESLDSFRKLCGNAPTPCTFVQVPEKGIVLQHIGKTTVEDIEKLTGKWEQS